MSFCLLSEAGASSALVRVFAKTCLIFISLFLLVVAGANRTGAQEEYLLGPEDEIEIRVWDHDDLTRTLRVGLDGRLSYPFIGELKAQGLTVLQLQKELERRLGDGYIVDPHVSIKVTDYQSQKFFVMGGVQKPGAFPLTKGIKVVEAISLAGGLATTGGSKPSTGSMAIIVRARPGEKRNQPQMPDKAASADKVTVSLNAALAGDPRHNPPIGNGDTIFVPLLTFYVTGEVKNPGRFAYEEGMTVLMAVTTAGGFTDKASSRRTHIIRARDGVKAKVEVRMDDPVQPGDAIVVPESWF